MSDTLLSHRLRLGVLIACLAFSSAIEAQSNVRPNPQLGPTAEARLEPGDIVKITVWRKPEYSGEFTIDPNGAPRHPLYKKVTVVGMPIAEVERRLIAFLTDYEQNPQVVIEPLFRVTVGGEVTTPNLYSLPRETTILQAIALAGGPTDRGSLNKVRIIREGNTIEADLTLPNAEWATRRILSGDQIIMTRKRKFLTDVVTPFAAIVGAVAAIINITRK